MTDRSATKLAIWPFFIVDVLFLGLAYLIFTHAHRPLVFWEALALTGCASIGAWSFLTPFLRRNDVAVKLAESESLATTVAQINSLEQVAAQISSATNYLKSAQDESKQTVAAAKGIADKMAEESRLFGEFMQKANDTEKSHLRLEVEKLRRSEVDWIQILVHILDQVFALHQASVRSGKLPLIEQIGNFQIVCRDAARRVGLVCQTFDEKTLFNETLHQLLEGQTKPEFSAPLSEILAPGYFYQGRPVRRALVRLQGENDSQSPSPATPANEAVENAAEEMSVDKTQESLF